MKLYTFPVAPNPRRVALFLKTKAIEINTEEIDLSQGEQFADHFTAINPNSTVPTLVLEDGTLLTEVIGILSYLDDIYPEKKMLGESILERALIISLMHRIFIEGMTAIAEALRNRGKTFENRALPGKLALQQIPELVERGQKRIHHFFVEIDGLINNKSFFIGNSLSQADIDAFVLCDFAAWIKVSIPDDCINLQQWYDSTKRALGE